MTPPADDTVSRLFNAHARALRLYARQWVDAAGAEDVVQRVFVRLLAGGRLPAEPRTWLFRCVRNEAVSAWRSVRRRQRRERAVADADASPYFVPRPDDPVDAVDAQDALRALPAEQREVVVLRIWSGLTLAEVSAITGRPVSTIYDQYRAALSAMRRHMESPCRKSNR